MDFITKLRTLCDARGTSVKQLERELGYSNGSLSKGSPNSARLYEVANYFDVPMEYFFDEEAELMEERRQKRLAYYQNELGFLEKRKEVAQAMKEKPLFRASAGQGAYNDTYADKEIEAEEGYEYAEVVGDSMLPELRDGDIVKIQPQTETTPHDFTLVKVDGEHATIKFVEIVSDGVWLRALNKEVFEDKFYTIQEVMTLPITVIGKVVEVQRKFK